jgi:hypothetical protein
VKLTVIQLAKNAIMKTKGPLLCSQEPTTGPHPEPVGVLTPLPILLKVGLSLRLSASVCVSPLNIARQRGLLFNERRDRPFNVGILIE